MMSADVFALIEDMGELPSLPRTLLTIQNVASDERSSADDLARCILEDQALTMRVLKVVNSAFYQRRSREQIRSVHRAVIVMGFETVRKLALGLSVFDMMSKLSRSPQLAHVASHSLVTAGLAQILAEATGNVPPEEAFVTALVHDIGKVVLTECSPAAMDAALKDIRAGVPPLEAERRHFGITHDRAGRRLAARWQLPADLQNMIGDHHDIDPLEPPRRLDPGLAVLVFANALSHCTDRDPDADQVERILYRAVRSLGIPSARVESLVERVQREVPDLARRMGVEIDDLTAYAQVVNASGSASVAPHGLSEAEVAHRTARQLELYQRIGRGLAGAEDPAALLVALLEGAVAILGFERVLLLDVDRHARVLRPRAWAGPGAAELAARLVLPLGRESGPVALAVLERRLFHVPAAASEVYAGSAGEQLLAVARCTGYAVAPVVTLRDVVAALYADGGPDGSDVVAEQASELAGLALQAGLVMGLVGAAT